MEAVFASFLLLTSILISVYVFDSSLKTEANNEQRTTAAIVAENALEEIRAAANHNFSQLQSNFNGRRWTLPSYTQFEVEAKIEPQPLALPCTELESQYPLNPVFPTPERRFMSESVWKCEVAVHWSRGQEELRMVRYMANLKQISNFRVDISPPGATQIDADTTGGFAIGPGGTLDFEVTATADGQTVSDVQFTWYVEPLDGFGSVYRVSREGDQCRYRNSFVNSDGNTKFAPGLCDLVVRAVYQGVEAKRKVRIQNG